MFMDTNRHPSEQPSARRTEEGDRFNRTLFAALDALEKNQIPYALIGGVAAAGMGRPRSTHDIDIFVRPEDAESALGALKKNGFRIQKTDPAWLFKGWKEDILVDVIFKSSGDIYFDDEMNDHVRVIKFHGRDVRSVAPEDLIIIKSAVHNEVGPHHWHDALAILSHTQMNWDYLLKRARRAPRRLLALLIYAQSNDILIPNRIIFDLYDKVYGQFERRDFEGRDSAQNLKPVSKNSEKPQHGHSPKTSKIYMAARIREALAHDDRTGDQDLKIIVGDSHVLVRGEIGSETLKRTIEEVIRDAAPGFEIDNQLKIPDLPGPEGSEYIQ